MNNGYRMLYKPEHPLSDKIGYIMEHRFVACEKWGNEAVRNNIVHHINGIKTDNRISNLRIFSPSKHQSHHQKERIREERKILISFFLDKKIKRDIGIIAKRKGMSMSALIHIALSDFKSDD